MTPSELIEALEVFNTAKNLVIDIHGDRYQFETVFEENEDTVVILAGEEYED